MSWNGSNNKKVESGKKVERRGGISPEGGARAAKQALAVCGHRGLIAGGIVVLVGGLSAWFILGRERMPSAPQSDESASSSQITEVKPHVVTNVVEEAPKKKKYSEMTNAEKLKELQDKYGDNPPPGVAQVMYFLKNPPKKGFKTKGSTPYLRHASERYIAGVGLASPGTRFFVEPHLDPRFDRDFEMALKTPIEINDDDTPDVVETKKAVEAIKQEIAQMSAETGKQPSEIIYEHAKTMYELGQYQLELEKQIEKVRSNPDFSDEDYLDYVRAANEMLKNKGIDEMPLPNVTRRAFQLEHARRMQERRKEKQNTTNNI